MRQIPAIYRNAASVILAMLFLSAYPTVKPAHAQTERVDLALVLAVDVSQSVDDQRFRLQMDGIAAALETPAVQSSVLSGPRGAMLVSLVQWSNRPFLSVPWTLLASERDIRRVAEQIRHLRRADGTFTCMSVALRSIADKVITQLPIPADRLVIDVSGDGHDNCNPLETVDTVRDDMVTAGATINGLPILEGDEADTLAAWYRAHVIGGPNAFFLPATGFADVERAMRRKFVTEMSAATCDRCLREARR
jgi:hypothetical protein